MQSLIPAGAAAKVSAAGSTPTPAPNPAAQPNLHPLAGASPSPAETLAHTAAKSAAIGASTFKFHETVPPPAANSTPPPATATPAKAPSQGGSNGSPGNDSNAKPDGASKSAGARTDEKPFVQSLDTAASIPANGHTSGAAAGPVAAAAAQTQNSNSGAPPAAPASADSRAGESLPATAQNSAVVNAAHILAQPGQTEIRIEMQADSLGSVELRAHIAGDQIGASIAVEHHDAQLALATDLPALHSALAEKNLRVEILSVSQGNFSSLSGNAGHDAGQRGFAQSPAKFAYLEQPKTPPTFGEGPADWVGQANSSAGLSVVA